MTILRLIRCELMKLKRSLIGLVMLAIPLVVFILLVTIVVTGNGPDDWVRLSMSGAAIWSYFLLPMTATAVTALQAQIEHGSHAWTHTLALPFPKAMVFSAKAIVSTLIMAKISLLLWFAILSGGLVAGWLVPDEALNGPVPYLFLADMLVKMWLAGWLVMAIQFIAANAFSNFAVPIVVGIAGTFVAMVATSAKAGIYFPWLLPTNILASHPERALQALLSGIFVGLLVFAASCLWLGRKDWY